MSTHIHIVLTVPLKHVSLMYDIIERNHTETISMYMNKLTGSIPDSLYNLTSLKALVLYNNVPGLSGSINSDVGNLQRLEEFVLNGNVLLGGSIPSELGFCHNLSENLTNTIPRAVHPLSTYLILI